MGRARSQQAARLRDRRRARAQAVRPSTIPQRYQRALGPILAPPVATHIYSAADNSHALPSRRREIMKTLADQFAEILAPAGARPIYGIVGDSLNGLTDALRRQGRIEWVHVRHEEGFHCQRHDACNDRTADYDKDPPQAAL